MMVAVVHLEPTFRAEPPSLLFETEYPIDSWDVMPDGQRFVAVLRDEEKPEPEQIVVIPDFAEELKARFREAERLRSKNALSVDVLHGHPVILSREPARGRMPSQETLSRATSSL